MTKYTVKLSEKEENRLRRALKSGKWLSRDYLRMQILLLSHEGVARQVIARRLNCSYSHVCNSVRKYSNEGLERAIVDEKRKGKPSKLQGKQKAHLIALACSDPPEGRRCWTMELLAQKCIELHLIDFICDDTVRRILKKTRSSHGKQRVGVSHK